MSNESNSIWTTQLQRTRQTSPISLIQLLLLLWMFEFGLPLNQISVRVSSQHLATGPSQTCFIAFDGSLTCSGQALAAVPNPVPFQQLTPPVSDNTFIQIDSNSWEVCALRSNGTGICMGYIPVEFAGPYIEIRSGGGFACGKFLNLTLDCWWTWADQNWGELDVEPTLQFESYDCGMHHCCGVLMNGTAYCWGSDLAPPSTSRLWPIPVLEKSESVVQVSVHAFINCMLLNTSQVKWRVNIKRTTHNGWGGYPVGFYPDPNDPCNGMCTIPVGQYSQVVVANTAVCLLGVSVSSNIICYEISMNGITNSPQGIFIELSAGDTHVCGIKVDNQVSCWGTGAQGQLEVPAVSLARGPCTTIRGNSFSTCLYCSGDPVRPLQCWTGGDLIHRFIEGQNQFTHFTPLIDPTLTIYNTFVDFQCTEICCCWLSTHGRLSCWTTIPDDTLLTQTCYDLFEAPSQPYSFTSIKAGYNHTCGLLTNSTIRCVGDNTFNQSYVPGLELLQFQSITLGRYHSCGILLDTNFVYCWGDSNLNRLASPANVSFASVSAGAERTCGIFLNNTMTCWGDQDSTEVPVLPLPGTNWSPSSLACDQGSSPHCCLFTDDTHIVSCAGSDGYYQSTPVYPFPFIYPMNITILRTKEIVVGFYHTCLLMEELTSPMICFGMGLPGPFTMTAIANIPGNMYQQNNETLPCPAGRYSVGRPGITPMCHGLCSPGRFAASASDSQLIEGCGDICPIGFYCPIGSGAPLPCPDNTYSFLNGSAYCSGCTPPLQVYNGGSQCGLRHCPPGTHPQGDQCMVCDNHQFSSGNTSSCLACPPHTYVTNNCDLAVVDSTLTASCSTCDTILGVDCSAGFPLIQSGYWGMYQFTQTSSPSLSTTFDDFNVSCVVTILFTYTCPGQFCSGSVDPLLASNSSVMINPCDTNRLMDPTNLLCRSCQDGFIDWNGRCVVCDSTQWGLIFVIYIGSFFFVLFLHVTSQNSTATIGILLYFIQSSLIFMSALHSDSTFLWLLPFNFTPPGSTCLIPVSVLVQKSIPILSMFFFIFHLVCIGVGSILLRRWKHSHSHSESSHSNIRTLPLLNEHDYSLSHPSHNMNADKSEEPLNGSLSTNPMVANENQLRINPYIRSFLAILLLSYIPISLPCFQFLFQCINIGDEKIIFSLPTLSCDSDTYRQLLGPVILLVCLILSGPIILFYFLFKHTQQIHANDFQFKSRYGILYESYHGKTYYYGVIILVRRLSLTMIDTIHFEIGSSKFVLFSLANLAFLVIHIGLHPMRLKRENQFETISLIILCIISNLLLSLDSNGGINLLDDMDQHRTTLLLLKLLILIPTCSLFLWIAVETWVDHQPRMKRFTDWMKSSLSHAYSSFSMESKRRQPIPHSHKRNCSPGPSSNSNEQLMEDESYENGISSPSDTVTHYGQMQL